MTAGRGGQYGEPGSTGGQGGNDGPDVPDGPPRGWQPAPPPPPPGWNMPQQPYPYGPAPTAPQAYGPPPPGSAERPLTVRAGIGAFVATMVIDLVASAAIWANQDEVLDQAIDQAGAGLSGSERETAEEIARLVVQFSLAAGVVFAAVTAVFLWFAWRGRNWARVVLWVLGGLSVLSGFAGVGGGGTGVGFVDGLNLFSWLITLVGVVLLALQPSNEWYRYMRWARAAGQHR